MFSGNDLIGALAAGHATTVCTECKHEVKVDGNGFLANRGHRRGCGGRGRHVRFNK